MTFQIFPTFSKFFVRDNDKIKTIEKRKRKRRKVFTIKKCQKNKNKKEEENTVEKVKKRRKVAGK